MRSAFWRGVELLREPESDSVEGQGKTVENPGKSTSERMEGITGVPKNTARLKSVLDELMSKVVVIATWLVSANTIQDLPKGADQDWISRAKMYAEASQEQLSEEKAVLADFLTQLEVIGLREYGEEWGR